MKTKLLNKKLSLKKSTVSNLENEQMDKARGGLIEDTTTSKYFPCNTACDTYCIYTACSPTCCTSIEACSC